MDEMPKGELEGFRNGFYLFWDDKEVIAHKNGRNHVFATLADALAYVDNPIRRLGL